MKEFIKALWHLMLESGNGSHIFQAYDQDIALKDKSNEKGLTQALVARGKRMPDQWDLVAVVLSACVGSEYAAAWKSSFQKVNFVGNYIPWNTWKAKDRIKEAFLQASFLPILLRPEPHADGVCVCVCVYVCDVLVNLLRPTRLICA